MAKPLRSSRLHLVEPRPTSVWICRCIIVPIEQIVFRRRSKSDATERCAFGNCSSILFPPSGCCRLRQRVMILSGSVARHPLDHSPHQLLFRRFRSRLSCSLSWPLANSARQRGLQRALAFVGLEVGDVRCGVTARSYEKGKPPNVTLSTEQIPILSLLRPSG